MDYLLIDETFEGIDPVIRVKIKYLYVPLTIGYLGIIYFYMKDTF